MSRAVPLGERFGELYANQRSTRPWGRVAAKLRGQNGLFAEAELTRLDTHGNNQGKRLES